MKTMCMPVAFTLSSVTSALIQTRFKVDYKARVAESWFITFFSSS